MSLKLPAEVESAVQSLMNAHGGVGSVELLDLPRLVPDHVEKAIVFTPHARPALLVMIAPPAYPDCVREAFRRADAARVALDRPTGDAVQVALHNGWASGQSFAVVPFLAPLARGRVGRRWEAFLLRRPIFAWLREVTRRTVSAPHEDAIVDGFLKPLAYLSKHQAVSERVRSGAGESLRALEGGRWQPRWVLAHNDLWLGNFLHRQSAQGDRGFAVIDWGASEVRGRPLYDLMTMARSINLSFRALRNELREHGALLGCEPGHAKHHLLAALAGHSMSLGEWPVERFAATADRLTTLLDEAG